MMRPRSSSKRQRKGSPDTRDGSDKERAEDSLLQDARRIEENLRVYMNAKDAKGCIEAASVSHYVLAFEMININMKSQAPAEDIQAKTNKMVYFSRVCP
ncbi:unnamed protein product [Nezara viridula]|uniref:Uncharacterized protein n=1 Tax=Nezara viridula TaxID=85310 RepID=A0A9P0EBY6_NEZVI|nr:unnamed protein product [Nezara viridula]